MSKWPEQWKARVHLETQAVVVRPAGPALASVSSSFWVLGQDHRSVGAHLSSQCPPADWPGASTLTISTQDYLSRLMWVSCK